MARQTRLVLIDPAGSKLLTEDRRLVGIDLTDIPNANSAAPIMLSVEQQCDLDHWHQVGREALPPYDNEAWAAEPTGVHHQETAP